MDVGRLVNRQGRNRNLPPGLIWLVGALAVCRGVYATFFPAIRRIFNV